MEQSWVTVQQRASIRCLSLDKADLRALLDRMQERSVEAGKIEVERYYRPLNPPPAEKLEALRQEIGDGFRLLLTVEGVDGTLLHGGVKDVFDSPNFPAEVKSIFFDTGNPLKAKGYYVANRCLVLLDFSRPGVLDFSFQPSGQTSNASNVEVQGRDATWVNGVFHEAIAFARERPSGSRWLHGHGIYDLLLWLLGAPAAFWCSYRVSGSIHKAFTNSFLQAAAYVYIFFVTLYGFRILFQYARWIWPPVEYKHAGSRAAKHKYVLGAIALSVIGAMIWSVIQAL